MLEQAIADRESASGRVRHAAGARLPLRHLVFVPLAILAVLLILAAPTRMALTAFYTRTQDLPLLLAAIALAALSITAIPTGERRLWLSDRAALLVAGAIAVLGYAGHRWLLAGYDLTRDEQMATFDSLIFAAGRLVEPVPPSWLADVDALNTTFLIPVSHPLAFVSAYLPGNAALRTLLGSIADPAITGPLLTGLAALLLWQTARLLWPEEREPAVVALIVLALSGQVLMTAMTAYAMPAYLCLNLLWLWLLLLDRRSADIAALAAGFVATGLHQPIFHPLFVAPWLIVLLGQRNWSRLALFVIGYGLIGAFWFAWPMWMRALVESPQSVAAAVGTDYLTRLKYLLRSNADGLPLMASNLLRFISWQHILLMPLLGAGLVAAKRDSRAAALAGGIALTVLAMALLLPYQGHGFGYRYLHGLIGPAALLAGYGWRQLSAWHAGLRPVVVRASVATALILLPLQASMAHRFYAPYAAANAKITAADADYVIIGGQDAPFAGDLVINRPDLSNRPLRLLGDMVSDPAVLATRICRPGIAVALPTDTFLAGIDHVFGTEPSGKPGMRRRELQPVLEAAGCRVMPLE